MTSLFFAPIIPSIITIMTFLYSLSFVFQRTETLETAFQSKTGSRTIWIISSIYSFWSHPFNSFNKLLLYFDTNHYLYPLILINLMDCFLIISSTVFIIIKLMDVYKHPKHLSNYELASLTHVTVVLFFQHMLFIFILLMIFFFQSSSLDNLKNVLVHKRGTWSLFCIFVPFSYPYSMLFSLLFSGPNKEMRRVRSVTFNARRMRRVCFRIEVI
ncbi:hypothetical protein CRE_30694 [Caenorhabditis remanei]|uniref:Uncharacterized protein n=1 Tax=Caenorhabditis remanei TaxID=31234 RepID=E3LTS3_CAERE|nr:hypothetical protein CRE_30694 [Caenorhabditis remanei]